MLGAIIRPINVTLRKMIFQLVTLAALKKNSEYGTPNIEVEPMTLWLLV